MNTKSLVVACLVVALVVAAWIGLRGGGDADAVPDAMPPAATQGNATPQKAEPASANVTDAGAVVQPAVDRTAAVLEGVGSPPFAGKTAVVRGRLVDGSHAPRAGEKIEMAFFRTLDGIEIDMPVPMNRGSEKSVETTTRPDGTFDFMIPVDCIGGLEVPSEDLVLASGGPNIVGRKGNQDIGDVVAVGSARLVGVVKDERGTPVAAVRVAATIGALAIGVMNSSTTDEAGKFRVGKLRPGKWVLRTASARFLPTIEEVTLQAGEQRTDLVLVVKPGQAISGQVIDDRGLPVAGAKVGCKRKEVRGAMDIERFAPDEAAVTDAGGFFLLSGLSGEKTTVRAFGAKCTSASAADVPVGTGDLVLRVNRLASIEGTLLTSDGVPIAGSDVRAVEGAQGDVAISVDEVGAFPSEARAKTAADGTFLIEAVVPGSVNVTANGASHRPVRQEAVQVLPAQRVQGVRLIAELGAVARVTVVDAEGKPVAGAKVSATPPSEPEPAGGNMRIESRRLSVENRDGEVSVHGASEAFGSAVTDDAGIAVIRGLPAVAAELHARHDLFANAVPAPVTLPRSGVVEASLTLRTAGFAAVRVLAVDGTPVVAGHVRVKGPQGTQSKPVRGVTDASGGTKIGPLAEGTYHAELLRSQGGTNVGGMMFMFDGDEGAAIAGSEQVFTIVPGETTVVELRRPQLTTVVGTVLAADGPLAGCSVEIEKDRGDSADDPEASGIPGLPGSGGGRSVTSGADGGYAINDIEPGDYVLRYGKPEQIVKARLAIRVRGEVELRQDLALRTGKLRVQAWNKATSEPIAGAEVEVHEAAVASKQPQRRQRVMMMAISLVDGEGETTTMSMGGQRARTGPDGWAEIDDVPVGAYDLTIKHRKHCPANKNGQAVYERQTTDCGKVEMAAAGSIRGTVVTADGKPVQMALVESRPVGSDQSSEPAPAMGGKFLIEALPGGRHLVKARALTMGPGGPGAYGPEVEVLVKAGEAATAEVRLPAQ